MAGATPTCIPTYIHTLCRALHSSRPTSASGVSRNDVLLFSGSADAHTHICLAAHVAVASGSAWENTTRDARARLRRALLLCQGACQVNNSPPLHFPLFLSAPAVQFVLDVDLLSCTSRDQPRNVHVHLYMSFRQQHVTGCIPSPPTPVDPFHSARTHSLSLALLGRRRRFQTPHPRGDVRLAFPFGMRAHLPFPSYRRAELGHAPALRASSSVGATRRHPLFERAQGSINFCLPPSEAILQNCDQIDGCPRVA